MTSPVDFARRMGMSPARSAEFSADIARLAEQVAPLVYERLADKPSISPGPERRTA